MINIHLTPILCTALVALHSPAFAGEEGWTSDFAAAKKEAAQTKKDLLLNFTGSDWCGWCIRLKKEVFSQEPFKTGVKDTFVLVEIDFPQKTKLAEEIQKQNKELDKKYAVNDRYPTVLLTDAEGLPYAQTGYQSVGPKGESIGPEAYVAHLNELRGIKIKRDEAFAAADKATDDVEKAKFLVEGLKAMDEEVVETNYADVIQKITQLDKDDKTGYLKARKEALAKKEAQAIIQKFMGSKIQPLMQAKEFDKALTEVKTFIKENPNTPEGIQVSMLINIGLVGPMTRGDNEGAMAVLDDVAKAYPESALAKNLDEVKAKIKAKMDSAAKAKDKQNP